MKQSQIGKIDIYLEIKVVTMTGIITILKPIAIHVMKISIQIALSDILLKLLKRFYAVNFCKKNHSIILSQYT